MSERAFDKFTKRAKQVLQIATEPMLTPPAAGTHVSSPVSPEDGLGLSACQGILQEHRGQMSRERRADGAILLRVELPVTEAAPSQPKESTVPVLWQSRPYA